MAPRVDQGDRPNSITKLSFLKFMNRLDDAKSRMRDANKLAAEERGVIRGILKTLEQEGGSKFAVKMLDALTDLDGEAAREDAMTALYTYAGWQELPLWRPGTDGAPQGAMFEDDDQTKQELQVRVDRTVRSDGYNSGLGGGKADENPHMPGERNHQTWSTAFAEGAKKREVDAKKAPKIASTKPRPGRPPAAAKAPKPAKPAGEKRGPGRPRKAALALVPPAEPPAAETAAEIKPPIH